LSGRQGDVWMWLRDNWPYAAQSVYDRKSPFFFVACLPAVTSPLIFPATVVGIGRCLKDRSRAVVAGIPLLVLVVHSFLTATGKMASSGEVCYMLVAAPFWGVLAAEGWEWLAAHLELRHAWRWLAVATLFPVLLNNRLGIGPVRFGYQILPLRVDAKMQAAKEVAELVGRGALRKKYPKLMASHTAIYYFLDESMSGPNAREWCKEGVDTAPPGTLLIWEQESAMFNADVKRVVPIEEVRAAGWVEGSVGAPVGWYVFHSRE
jgi:hypothetical protein